MVTYAVSAVSARPGARVVFWPFCRPLGAVWWRLAEGSHAVGGHGPGRLHAERPYVCPAPPVPAPAGHAAITVATATLLPGVWVSARGMLE
ncbi:hypothetical protein AAFF_G00162630 [Aldrovandia affinis]|uniref:Uncharacterized protein n=1 Tax=Aldrovandia affinis TaxID=143900 RepID=A0AAD7SZ58_9TELE|nr:hypothetical protein AAFF_G00162630 [Aldrovandia affinis]